MRVKTKNITTLEDISELLDVAPSKLMYFSLNMKKNVREFEKNKKNSSKQKRKITAPSKELRDIQRKIKEKILNNYSYNKYIYGLGGNTLKQHARVHQGRKSLVQMDLKDFYPSIKNQLVYNMWLNKFEFDHNASRVLTKLTTMHGGLKQGFPTSSHIAAIVAEEFTSHMYDYCKENKLKFSQYVDDINISGNEIDYRLVFKTFIPIGRQYGLTIKKTKTKVADRNIGKTITGVSLYEQRTRVPREVMSKAINALKNLSSDPKNKHYGRVVSGYLGFVKHLNKADGRKYRKMRDKIIK